MAQGSPSSEYRALVCVFLHGGNDSWNMMIPVGSNDDRLERFEYFRPTFASWKNLNGTTAAHTLPLPVASTTVDDWSLNPQMAALQSLFGDRKLAFVGNTGTLKAPGYTKTQFFSQDNVPPRLFSHEDQVRAWQLGDASLSRSEGWGGLLQETWLNTSSPSTTQRLSLISLGGGNDFQIGGTWGVPFCLNPGAVPTLKATDLSHAYALGRNVSSVSKMKTLMDTVLQGRSHLLEKTYAEACRSAIELAGTAPSLLFNETTINTDWTAAMGRANTAEHDATGMNGPGAGDPNSPASILLNQLKMVYRVIRGSRTSLNRQVFFVSLGGFDTHGGRNDALLYGVAYAMRTFYEATKNLDSSNSMLNDDTAHKAHVLTFTCSDFGRTLSESPGELGGTEHAWGGTQMVMGNDVNGGAVGTTSSAKPYIGSMPETFLSASGDTPSEIATEVAADSNVLDSRGLLLPSTSTAQYLGAIGKWFLADLGNSTAINNALKAALPDLNANPSWLSSLPSLTV